MTTSPRRPRRRNPSPILLAALAAALLLAGALGGRTLGTLLRDGLDRILPGQPTTGAAEALAVPPHAWPGYFQAANHLARPA